MNCVDCGIEVRYEDANYWPFIGADGSALCPMDAGGGNVVAGGARWGHRVDRDSADAAFDAFEAATGQRARHR
jgi:hypothetical protein